MKVETYEAISLDEQGGEIINELVSEEALALIESLDLDGQRELIVTDPENETEFIFWGLIADRVFDIIKKWMPNAAIKDVNVQETPRLIHITAKELKSPISPSVSSKWVTEDKFTNDETMYSA